MRRPLRATPLPALLLLAALAAPAAQEPPATPADAPPTVEQLIAQLGHPDHGRRAAAQTLLEKHGPAALPALQKALTHKDAEVRRRAGDLIPAIEMARLMEPKRVTLKLDKKTMREVMNEVEKQTGYKVEFYFNSGADGPNHSFEFKNATLWEVLDEVGKSTGLTYQQGYGDDRIRLQQVGNGRVNHHGGTAGIFRWSAHSLQYYKNVDLTQANPHRNESLTLSFSVFVEPKMPILGLDAPRLSEAYDSEKNSMLPPGQNPDWALENIRWNGGFRGRSVSRYGNGNKTYSSQTQVNLVRSSEKANAIKLLKGVVPVTLLSEQKPEVVAEDVLKAKGTKKAVGTTTVGVEEVTEVQGGNGQVRLKLTFTEENKDPNDYSWMNSVYQRVELQDDTGQKWQMQGTNWENNSPGHVQMTLTYGPMNNGGAPAAVKPGKPAKLIFYKWTVIQHQIPFEFKDVPLP